MSLADQLRVVFWLVLGAVAGVLLCLFVSGQAETDPVSRLQAAIANAPGTLRGRVVVWGVGGGVVGLVLGLLFAALSPTKAPPMERTNEPPEATEGEA